MASNSDGIESEKIIVDKLLKNEVLKKISGLFTTFDGFSALQYISCKGVIAGGSAVFGLCDFVPPSSVGDIDVFVNDKNTFFEIINWIKNKYKVESYGIFDTEYCSVISIKIQGERVEIQLIYQNWERPEDVIRSFDMDYVQCCIYEEEVQKTHECQESHSKRKIIRIRDTRFKMIRFEKAIKKGFKCPIFGEEKSSVRALPRVEYDVIEKCLLQPFKTNIYFDDAASGADCNYTRNKWYFVDDVRVLKFKLDKKKKGFVATFGKFVVVCGDKKVKVDVISVDVYAVDRCSYTIDEKMSQIFSDIRCGRPRCCVCVTPGSKTAVIRAYQVDHNIKLRGKVVSINENASGLKFDKNFKIGSCPVFCDHDYPEIEMKINKITKERFKSDWIDPRKIIILKAYRAFLYGVKEKEDLKKCILNACMSKISDCRKYHFNKNGDLLKFSQIVTIFEDPYLRTVERMVAFVEMEW